MKKQLATWLRIVAERLDPAPQPASAWVHPMFATSTAPDVYWNGAYWRQP